MAEHDYKPTPRKQLSSEDIDRELDAALARYAAAEPRPGLEERVLANLRAEPKQAPTSPWWQWSLAATAAVVLIALSLAWRTAWRTGRPVAPPPNVAHTVPAPHEPEVQVAHHAAPSPLPRTHVPSHKVVAKPGAPPNPKLDQFPSPRPMSEEELALVRYVRDFPKEATQIAQAQEAYELEIQKKLMEARAETNPSGAEQNER